jgi:ADP-ribose pyrophosphatase YjhB (NUDIX family)
MAKRTIHQAGGIVFRGAAAAPDVLIVTARRNRKRWVLPKGRVKWHESAAAAALREVREEAGVRGRLVGRAGTAEYSTKQGRVVIEYFLIRYVREDGGDAEGRESMWCAVEDAISHLTYSSARRVLLDAYPEIVERARKLAARRRAAKRAGARR